MKTYHIIAKGINHKVNGDGHSSIGGRIVYIYKFTGEMDKATHVQPMETIAFVPKQALVVIGEEDKRPNWVNNHVKDW